MSLFEDENKISAEEPLAYRMRPKGLEDFVGQLEIVGENGFLRKLLDTGKIPSLILWGPPGSGKTTLAMIVAGRVNAEFVPLSAVSSGIKDIKEVIEKAAFNKKIGKKTILFIDEIHRFNKSQQDVFLPYVEDGTIILIGATTENPSFEVNSALLSRARVLTLKALESTHLATIIKRAVKEGLGKKKVEVTTEAYEIISALSNGDARIALNIIEMIDTLQKEDHYTITMEAVKKVYEKKTFLYDKTGEEHYNIISAFHKSLRGSDPDASLYWLARMLEAGEQPLYVARRMVRFASEDIGNADSNALRVALAAKDAFDFLGHPEGELALAQACLYLATAPKSNSVTTAFGLAQEDVHSHRDEPVPIHLRNAPTKLMKEMGYGSGYKYAHDYEGNYVQQDYMPEKLKDRVYYKPTENGYEKNIKERLARWKKK